MDSHFGFLCNQRVTGLRSASVLAELKYTGLHAPSVRGLTAYRVWGAETFRVIVGAVWVHIMDDYVHVDDEIPSFANFV